ncbi:MAG: hypothetical protein MJ025_03960, partial [Victivallaceae bacterium]|nr:hypothetical protein [Victivallaceae bacterium]
SPVPISPCAGGENVQWSTAMAVSLDYVAEESEFRPKAELKLVYDESGIAGHFRVDDRYVIGIAKHDQDPTWHDSCVECFLHTEGDPRYFNFEFGCTGNLRPYHIENYRTGKYDVVPREGLEMIKRRSSLPDRVFPEIEDPIRWSLGFFIPWDFFRKYSVLGPEVPSGRRWRGNFYKCAEHSSHPHWLTWAKMSQPEFHAPKEFGDIVFE